jgi:TetR/AcrR family transcriptional regulator, fatty acid metabolism regulator protein
MGVKPPGGVTFHQDARRRQLVDLAIELIGERGLGAASNSEIARRAGISRGVVNYNVGDRDTFLGLVVDRVYELGAEAVLPHVQAASGPPDALRAFVSASLDFYAARPAEMRALREIFADPELVERVATSGHRREVHDVGDVVRAGQRNGTVAAGPPELLVGVVRAALDWAAFALAAGADLEEVRREALRLVDRALLGA